MQRRLVLLSAGLTLIACLLGTRDASADGPPAAIKTMQLVAPPTVLGVTSPYLIAAPMKTSKLQDFTLSRNIDNLYRKVEKLARYGVDLNQRKTLRAEKVQLRVQTLTRGYGGVVKLCYKR